MCDRYKKQHQTVFNSKDSTNFKKNIGQAEINQPIIYLRECLKKKLLTFIQKNIEKL